MAENRSSTSFPLALLGWLALNQQQNFSSAFLRRSDDSGCLIPACGTLALL
jgi:hypothetical protein